jgi:hypothetical protein
MKQNNLPCLYHPPIASLGCHLELCHLCVQKDSIDHENSILGVFIVKIKQFILNFSKATLKYLNVVKLKFKARKEENDYSWYNSPPLKKVCVLLKIL